MGAITNPALPAVPGASPRPDAPTDSAREVALDFEAFFLGQVMAHMFTGLEPDPMFGGGPAEEIYRSMLSDEIGKAAARAGGGGIADSVMREILRHQEVGAS